MGYGGFEPIITELLVKRGLKLSYDTKTDQNSKFRRTLIRFKVVDRARNLPPLCPPAPNPRFDYSGDLNGIYAAFTRFLQEQVIALNPVAQEPLLLWSFCTKKAYDACFPKYKTRDGSIAWIIASLISGVAPNAKVKIQADLGYHDYTWTYTLEPQAPWSEIIPEIQATLAEPDIVAQYGLSVEAGNLLRWVRANTNPKIDLGCTPVVEEAINSESLRIGINWPRENWGALIEILSDEINSLTPYKLKHVRWNDNQRVVTRLRIR